MIFDYKLIIDSREKEIDHITSKFLSNRILYDVRGLPIGDYRIQSDTYSPPIIVERKASLDELIGNLLSKDKDNEGNNRFTRELIRASKTVPKTRVVLLIEDKDYYEKLLKGDYRSKVNPKAIRAMIMSLEAKYPNLSIVGVDKSVSASYIHTTLYYHLRQQLKEGANNEQGYNNKIK